MNEGGTVNVTKPGGNLRVNHAGVNQSDIVASNGRIHILDSALVSPALGASLARLALASGLLLGLALAGVPHRKGGVGAALEYLTDCAREAKRKAAKKA